MAQILVIAEDRSTIRHYQQRLETESGHRVLFANSRKAADFLFNGSLRFDLVIVDGPMNDQWHEEISQAAWPVTGPSVKPPIVLVGPYASTNQDGPVRYANRADLFADFRYAKRSKAGPAGNWINSFLRDSATPELPRVKRRPSGYHLTA